MRQFLCFAVSISALILLPHSCFAGDSDSRSAKASERISRQRPSFPIGDRPGGVSFWSDYRGPQYEGYASIGKERSRSFWEEKSINRINVPLDAESVLELKQLWKKYFNMRPDLKYDFSIFDTKNLKDWPDIDVVVAEIRRTELLSHRQKDKLHEKVLFEAETLSNTYLYFKALFKMPIEKRTTESFDESRTTLAEMIGEDAVQQLEQSWKIKLKSQK